MKDRDYSLLLLMVLGAIAWFAACVQEVSAPPDARPRDAGCVPAMIQTPVCDAQLVCPVKPYPPGCTDQPSGAVCCDRQ